MSSRQVFCADAIEWLKCHSPQPQTSLIASLPDISEFNLSLEAWKSWFIETAKLIFNATPAHGVTIFFQTDIKIEGRWIDKAYLIQKAAEECNSHQLFHKILCRVPPGVETKGRPAYSHLLCFSRELSLDVGKNNADVIPELGEKTWERGMGITASQMIAKFIKSQTDCHSIINPFCGEGSMLAAANVQGLHAIGIERSPKRAKRAESLQIVDQKFQFIV
jgi:hypothetical protein